MKKTKEVVAFFAMLMVLAIPVLVLAAPVPDTGQEKSYKDDGTETTKKPPALCTFTDSEGNSLGCKRTYSTVGSDGKTYNKFYNADGKEIHYFWSRRCYEADGTEGQCTSRKCYDNTDPGRGNALDPCPSTCYNSNKEDSRIQITCPASDDYGTGDNDFYGQDANYTINEQSYTTPFEGSDNLLKDERTGLVWLIKEDLDPGHKDSQPNNKNNKYTWSEVEEKFLKNLNFLSYENYNEWRLPTLKELALIVHCDEEGPAIDGDFSHMQSELYWTATPVAGESPTQAYCVNFDDGSISLADITEDEAGKKYVIAVRQDESVQAGKFIANETITDTITDTSTGLMWRKVSHTQDDWEGAMLSCEALEFGGFDDWRLPNRAELLSIVDYEVSGENALIDSSFAGFAKASYWTSTSYVKPDDSDPPIGKAWVIDFTDGTLVGVDKMTTDLNVLAVRGGQNIGATYFSMPAQASEWEIGRLLPIVWNKSSAGATVYLSRDGGENFEEIDGTRPDGDTSLIWTVEGDVEVDGDISDICVLKLEDKSGNELSQQGFFSIKATTEIPGAKLAKPDDEFNLADIIRGLKILAGEE